MNKLKIMRKIVKRENRNLDFASEDMSMWGAPGECWNIIEKSYAKHINTCLQKLNITQDDYDEYINKCAKIESTHIDDKCNPPYAFYDCINVNIEKYI